MQSSKRESPAGQPRFESMFLYSIETPSPDPGLAFQCVSNGGFGVFYFSMKANSLLLTRLMETMSLIWVQRQQNQNNEGSVPNNAFW
jgi:hypothetical protein